VIYLHRTQTPRGKVTVTLGRATSAVTWPVGLVLAIPMPTLTALTLIWLPVVKGAVVGLLWALAKPHHIEGTAP